MCLYIHIVHSESSLSHTHSESMSRIDFSQKSQVTVIFLNNSKLTMTSLNNSQMNTTSPSNFQAPTWFQMNRCRIHRKTSFRYSHRKMNRETIHRFTLHQLTLNQWTSKTIRLTFLRNISENLSMMRQY